MTYFLILLLLLLVLLYCYHYQESFEIKGNAFLNDVLNSSSITPFEIANGKKLVLQNLFNTTALKYDTYEKEYEKALDSLNLKTEKERERARRIFTSLAATETNRNRFKLPLRKIIT